MIVIIKNIHYKYNLKGYKVEERFYIPNNDHLLAKLLYKYDNKGNKIEITRYDSSNNLDLIMSFKYSYDDKGNWIKRIDFENNIPKHLIEREIEYL